MILTATKFVNARVGRPSINASNPMFLKQGDKITVKRKAWGDSVGDNNIWVVSSENEFYTSEGFALTDEFRSLQIKPPLFDILKINDLWRLSKGEGINIGIIDNGVHHKHVSLGDRVTQVNTHTTTGFTNHGTTMACIAAARDESRGKIGIAPMINKIFSYQINIDEKSCRIEANVLLDALDALENAGAHIINMSFTCDQKSFFPNNDLGRRVQQKINLLVKKNIILVSATGNDFKHDSEMANRFPAGYDNVISVTGLNFSGEIDCICNCWKGVSISTLQEHYFDDDQFDKSNGTSSATAIITGCIACAYNKIGSRKNEALKTVFSKMPLQRDRSGPFSVPKFDIDTFINLIN